MALSLDNLIKAAAAVGSARSGRLCLPASEDLLGEGHMRFAGWYLKIAAVGASIGAAMELFMIHTGFYEKVTVLESEKRAWESSPEAQAMREALNPWHKHDEQEQQKK
ncbi:hypothetical protein Zm00014a_013236 [Zea mays]|uniref:Uncharacterized protein n=3 Tax=Zea mays TaxID=4577 RepID=A0A1D6EJ33_MAIZE|nr:hypothetical protein ZEAMMB73_Zm00001d005081 [Zea mays]PWZ40703.1 hypothetical protein Zm00014a_013236 [Zea mays]|eukprot:XP_008669956.1 uncharacterized protein LOC100278222 [Zea mays]